MKRPYPLLNWLLTACLGGAFSVSLPSRAETKARRMTADAVKAIEQVGFGATLAR